MSEQDPGKTLLKLYNSTDVVQVLYNYRDTRSTEWIINIELFKYASKNAKLRRFDILNTCCKT
jgi:hypothetical protein